jgi:hypothetical protein
MSPLQQAFTAQKLEITFKVGAKVIHQSLLMWMKIERG